MNMKVGITSNIVGPILVLKMQKIMHASGTIKHQMQQLIDHLLQKVMHASGTLTGQLIGQQAKMQGFVLEKLLAWLAFDEL